ncbi:MAG TPA: ABC transporter permease, partial [Vicinamibacterales bacterium]|nr:ABC transporter permease [Vicinamibacterales bacterium]
MKTSRVPGFARALLKRALPKDVREHVSGDLEERFLRDTESAGANAARWRYRRAALTFSTRFLLERLWDGVRALGRIRLSLLDFRLGVRMLARYPMLTVVGGIALSLAIALGAAVFAFVSLMLWPTLPLPEGDRIVSVRLYDEAASEFEDRVSSDFQRWKRQSSSLVDLGAGRSLRRNLATADDTFEQVTMAEVTATTFDLVRLPPVLGRALVDADAAPAAPPVMVIGHALWRRRFGSDPGVIGQSVMLGETPTTIVGVMAEGMKFPSAHEVWVPLRMDDGAATPRSGAGLRIWARLKRGVSLQQASVEMATLGAQSSADWPATHAHLRPIVKPFAMAMGNLDPEDRMLMASANVGVALLILLISGNVALLMFARAATRESEILVRTALGASRGRVIAQFFSEALVLSAIAAVVGLTLARAGIRWAISAFTLAANEGQPLPFWFSQPLPPLAIAYGCGLALMAAVVTGVLPALKVTRGLHARLRETTAGGGGLKFGGVWTVLIVTQVAVTITFPVVTYFVKRDGWQIEERTIGVPPEQVLSARLSRDRDITPERYVAAVGKVREGLAAVPGVREVTLADKLPLMWHGHYEVEVDAGGSAPKEKDFEGYRISTAAVDTYFFAAFDAEALAGRLFTPSDYVQHPRVVIVNQPFIDRVLGGGNPIGRRVRYVNIENSDADDRSAIGADQPWLEIIGVVRDLGMAGLLDPKVAGFYEPLNLRSTSGVYVGARVNGDLAAASKALRQLAAQADVTLRVTEVQPLDRVTASELREINFWTTLLGAVSLLALMLSLTGIYAVMSFAVSRRTREIGIRVALGSDRARVVMAVLRQPLKQVAVGIVCGAILVTMLSGQIVSTLRYFWFIAGYSLVMFGVCLLACLVPARRALRVDPIDA